MLQPPLQHIHRRRHAETAHKQAAEICLAGAAGSGKTRAAMRSQSRSIRAGAGAIISCWRPEKYAARRSLLRCARIAYNAAKTASPQAAARRAQRCAHSPARSVPAGRDNFLLPSGEVCRAAVSFTLRPYRIQRRQNRIAAACSLFHPFPLRRRKQRLHPRRIFHPQPKGRKHRLLGQQKIDGKNRLFRAFGVRQLLHRIAAALHRSISL